MTKNLLRKSPDFLIVSFLLLILVVDAISKILIIYDFSYSYLLPNRILKALIIALCILYYFFNGLPKEITKPSIITAASLLLVASAVNFLQYGVGFDYPLKYAFFIVLIPLFYYPTISKTCLERLDITLKFVAVLNLMLIIVGYVFDIQLFQTYFRRFGYNGFLLTPMQASYFYIFLLVFYFKNKETLFFLISLLSSILVGTKILWGFSLIIAIMYVVEKVNNKRQRALLFSLTFIIFSLVLWLFFKQKSIVTLFEDKGIWSVLFSTRNDSLSRLISDFNELNFNFLTGGINLASHRTEFELVDLFLCFGVFGLVSFFILFKNLFHHFIISSSSRFVVIVIAICILVAGNVLYYPVNCFFLLLTLLCLQKYDLKNNIS